MRLAYFDNTRLGVVVGNEIIDVSDAVLAQKVAVYPNEPGEAYIRPGDFGALIEHWDRFGPLLSEAARSGSGRPLSSVQLLAPVRRPINIDCLAMNFIEDGSGIPPAPINAFHKTAGAISGPGETMVLPDVPGSIFEAEAEMALIVGKRGYQVPASQAMEHVFGYVNLIDGSVRGLGPDRNNFYQMKSRDTFCTVGPYVVTKDEIADPQNLDVKLWNNGQLMQDFNTRDMAYRIERCVEFVSSVHTIEPGDIIALGTNHQGLHPLMDGDRIELEVKGLGRLTMDVMDELKRTWDRQTRAEHEKTGRPGFFGPQLTGKYAP
ncbi:fumarylacetoacetate hydrolase [Agrobacterium vitis]|uniref:Fumarylacetoacetate hydrolase family protein n=1 Tax=Agrobacterium vitis TaxID=373 RepID=A0AAE2R985_AGRVI|nr:fumarylacetoacetate hydrolase family protein [Agrobacterium vitis]MBF2714128.1 fumarylacetoacetate hydrolase family protein [Agrobacterium vitis]MUO81507.1 fumarylacetoacetate hydrolase [Agrobacterium vitis]MUO95846.1 fumarylacetoacetate hydrolase [Agrobacterium vitis]MVA93925.1 fumarylacetoacetate hydrolase [Agrobacterium vitis]MVB03568.1 fumarylacetoacetate hydrolase [Agrobacterium vitis]